MSECLLCQPVIGDAALERVQVWEDALWRLTASLASPEPGLCYLEPKRHIASIAELDGHEAATLGVALAWSSAALKAETGAEQVYVVVYGGGIPHLHLYLAPHRAGDAWNDRLTRGRVVEEPTTGGANREVNLDFPDRSPEELRAVAERLRQRLASSPPPETPDRSGPAWPTIPWVPRPPDRAPELPPSPRPWPGPWPRPWPDPWPEEPDEPDEPYRPRPRPNDPWW
jgi:diadenosine tetraphosphate (Ap4A) HIT family hydrolase